MDVVSHQEHIKFLGEVIDGWRSCRDMRIS